MSAPKFPESLTNPFGVQRGCPCACHGVGPHRFVTYHVVECHNPLLVEPPYKTVAPMPKGDQDGGER